MAYLLVAFLIAAPLLWLFRALHRIFFHPLSSFPGPTIAATTSWYRVAHAEDSLNHLKVWHERYGPVVRIGPNQLHFDTPEAFFAIYAIGSPFTKEPTFYRAFGLANASLSILKPDEAKARRDLVLPLFSRRSILKLESVVQHTVDKLIHLLGSTASNQPVNMHNAIRCLTMDVISSYCFAKSANTLDSKDIDFAHPLILSVQIWTSLRNLCLYFPSLVHIVLALPDWLANFLSPSTSGIRTYSGHILRQIDGILADPSQLNRAEHETIYHHLLNPKRGKLSKQDLVNEALILVSAGSETVAGTCNVGLVHVLADRRVRERVVQELTEAWPDSGMDIGYEKLEKLPYLSAVIKESLRKAHGTVSPLPRVVGANGANIGGYAVPPGTIVSMGVTFLHGNPNIFPEPEKFIPERWLTPDSGKLDNYIAPFSRGPRMCLGMNLAWCELYLIFGNLLRRLDMELFDTSTEDVNSFIDTFVPTHKGRDMRVTLAPSPRDTDVD